ncbi:MAG: hypothetical protein ABIH86_02990 [Planctomycetota bacterium]
MGEWIIGDLHVHSDHCEDGVVSIAEIVKRAKPFCDFIGISGHAKGSDNWGVGQYRDILEARKSNPGFPIFHTGEIEFPIERHTMVIAGPDDDEAGLQRELVKRFDRLRGAVGIEKACETMAFIDGWSDKPRFMIFNHPNSPNVPYDVFERLSAYPSFKVIACYDRGERRAPQTWDIGSEWDKLLMAGKRIWTRFGSDFHQHFSDGGKDYYPGEFAQDNLYVKDRSYRSIIDAYMSGNYFCTIQRIVSELTLTIIDDALDISFIPNLPVERMEIISDGRLIETVNDIGREPFRRTVRVSRGSYYRLRGFGVEQDRLHSPGKVTPVFLSNPVFRKE